MTQLIKQTIKTFLLHEFCFPLPEAWRGYSAAETPLRGSWSTPPSPGPAVHPSQESLQTRVFASSSPGPYQRLSSLCKGNIIHQPPLPEGDLRWVPGAGSNLLKRLRSLSPQLLNPATPASRYNCKAGRLDSPICQRGASKRCKLQGINLAGWVLTHIPANYMFPRA